MSRDLAEFRTSIPVQLAHMRQRIDTASDPRVARAVSAKAEVLRKLAKRSKESVLLINQVLEVKIRADRRMGQLLIELKESGVIQQGGDRRSEAAANRMKMSDLGIDRNEASRCQQLVGIPEDVLEALFEKSNAEELELSTAMLLRLAKANQAGNPAGQPNVDEAFDGTLMAQEPSDSRRPAGRSNIAARFVQTLCSEQANALTELLDHVVMLECILVPVFQGNDALKRAERQHLHYLVGECKQLLKTILE